MQPDLADQRVLTPGMSVTVEVPATSANLGPGFDCFGIALEWRERVNLAVIERGYQIEVSGEGAADLPRDESHLIIRAALVGLADLGVSAPGLWLGCRNTIPHGRGLGSSSAAIVGGLIAAAGLADTSVEPEWLLRHANAIEGHPDNVAAAIYGGFVLAYEGRSGVALLRLLDRPLGKRQHAGHRHHWSRRARVAGRRGTSEERDGAHHRALHAQRSVQHPAHGHRGRSEVLHEAMDLHAREPLLDEGAGILGIVLRSVRGA